MKPDNIEAYKVELFSGGLRVSMQKWAAKSQGLPFPPPVAGEPQSLDQCAQQLRTQVNGTWQSSLELWVSTWGGPWIIHFYQSSLCDQYIIVWLLFLIVGTGVPGSRCWSNQGVQMVLREASGVSTMQGGDTGLYAAQKPCWPWELWSFLVS